MAGGSPSLTEPPSSPTGASRSRRLEACDQRRDVLRSSPFSFLFASLLSCFLPSFSSRSFHQPARVSHFCAKTDSITWSIFTPAAFIRCSVSCSNAVEKGSGCSLVNISCCSVACSARKGWLRMSNRLGRGNGLFESSCFNSDKASAGMWSGYFGSSVKIFRRVTSSSSSSKGSSPHSKAYNMMPKLHTSTFSPAYFSPFSISGAE